MTIKEAIRMLKRWNEDLLLCADEEEGIECHNIAIAALEKQLPKKVNVTKYDVGGNDYFCSCGNKLRDSSEYCDMCGCKLDWIDSE